MGAPRLCGAADAPFGPSVHPPPSQSHISRTTLRSSSFPFLLSRWRLDYVRATLQGPPRCVAAPQPPPRGATAPLPPSLRRVGHGPPDATQHRLLPPRHHRPPA